MHSHQTILANSAASDVQFEICMNRALLLTQVNDQRSAIKEYTHAISLATCGTKAKLSAARAFLCRGICYRNLEMHTLAIRDFSTAISLGLNEAFLVRALQDRADCLLALNRKRSALHDLETALKYQPSNTAILRQHGIVSYSLLEYELAAQDFAKIVQMHPEDDEAHQNWEQCVRWKRARSMARRFKDSDRRFDLLFENVLDQHCPQEYGQATSLLVSPGGASWTLTCSSPGYATPNSTSSSQEPCSVLSSSNNKLSHHQHLQHLRVQNDLSQSSCVFPSSVDPAPAKFSVSSLERIS